MSFGGDFLHLFRGNPLVVGMDDAGNGKPGPLRLEPDMAEHHWKVLLEGHLLGREGIGVYPYNHEKGGVAWACVDFDEGDLASWSYAYDLRLALHDLGITGFIERSRSKGYHVWVFFGGWTSTTWARRLLIGCCQAVNAPDKEVNPKSVRLAPDQLGNFVRLPYKGAIRLTQAPADNARQVVVDDMRKPLSPALFLATALDSAVSEHEVIKAARTMHVQPEPVQTPLRAVYSGPWKDQLNGLAQSELANGPRPGSVGGRSAYLMGFARACFESGLTPADTNKALRLADYLHGRKYTDRKDADDRYEDMVRKTFNTAQEGA